MFGEVREEEEKRRRGRERKEREREENYVSLVTPPVGLKHESDDEERKTLR